MYNTKYSISMWWWIKLSLLLLLCKVVLGVSGVIVFLGACWILDFFQIKSGESLEVLIGIFGIAVILIMIFPFVRLFYKHINPDN